MSENLREDLDRWLDFECVEYNSGSTGIEYAIPLDVVEDKLLELQSITAADVPDDVKREIQADALDKAKLSCWGYVQGRGSVLSYDELSNKANKLRENKQ